jgi:hypothetical protein
MTAETGARSLQTTANTSAQRVLAPSLIQEEVMPEVTRRRFLVQSSLGVTAALGGALVTAPRLLPSATPAPAIDLGGPALAGPVVLHVRDVATAEVSLLVGTTETIYRDREMVGRLLAAARNAAAARGRR